MLIYEVLTVMKYYPVFEGIILIYFMFAIM